MTGKKSIGSETTGNDTRKKDNEWGSGVKQAGGFSDKERHGRHPPDTLHQGQKDLHPPKQKKH
jgi:hypothetical protein